MWTGIGNVSDDGLQKGLNGLLAAMADSIAEPRDSKAENKNKK